MWWCCRRARGISGFLPATIFFVIGAYPPEGTYNLCRGDKSAERDKALTTIPKVPLPDSDPVLGKDGPLPKLWRG